MDTVLWFDDPRCIDVDQVGGKNASLANMTCTLSRAGIRVPLGFAVTAAAYRAYLLANDIDSRLRDQLADYHAGRQTLAQTGVAIRQLIVNAELPAQIAASIVKSYEELAKRSGLTDPAVAVRSSATAEDLPQASFAGQQETFLNVRGEADLLIACRKCYASLFTDRAIVYRETNGFDHLQVALSIGVQRMVRSDRAGAGVAFTLDTETGFPGVVVVSAAWGLGENVVQGTVTPDKYVVFKPLLLDERYRPIIEKSLGAKEKKLVYGESGGAATRNVDTTSEEREAMVLAEEEICSSLAGRSRWRSTTVERWISSGPRTARVKRCSWCKLGRKRCSRPDPPR